MPTRWRVKTDRSVVWLATLFAAGSLSGCAPVGGGGGGENDNAVTPTVFAGSQTCQGCHGDEHEDWAATAHAGALETLKAIGQDANTVCVPCHTVGFGQEGGFVDEATTPQLAGVQCENCHGGAAEHVANNGGEPRPTVNLSSEEVCAGCHTDFHHPTADEWRQSKHASALVGLKESPFAQDSCLECHSQDYRYASQQQGEDEDEDADVDVPTLDTAALSIECVTCHAPHGGVTQVAQLRQPVGDLCGGCHTQGETALGSAPHHPQIDMLQGIGAFDENGDALEESGPHTSLAAVGGEACARCHVVFITLDEPTEEVPNATGHTFNPFSDEITQFQPSEKYAGCAPCHDPAGAESRRTSVQTDVTNRLEALAPYFDASSPSFISTNGLSQTDKDRLAVATFNFQYVDADGSRGAHNPTNASAALDGAEAIVEGLAP